MKRAVGAVLGPLIAQARRARERRRSRHVRSAPPAIGTPPGPVRRPVIVSLRPKALVSRTLREVRCQRALRSRCGARADAVGCARAAASTRRAGQQGCRGPGWCGRAPAPSCPPRRARATIRWCEPLLSLVVSKPTSALSDDGHGCRYRNAGSPSLVCPTSRQLPAGFVEHRPLDDVPVDCEHRLVDARARVARGERHVARARHRSTRRPVRRPRRSRSDLRAVRASGRRRRGRRRRRSCWGRLGVAGIRIRLRRSTRLRDRGEPSLAGEPSTRFRGASGWLRFPTPLGHCEPAAHRPNAFAGSF